MDSCILKRRSVRKFTEKKVEGELIDKLLEAGCAAPSACNRKPVDFYVITDDEKLTELSKCGRFTRFKSPLMIIVVGNLSRALPLGMADYWIHDAAAASENILIEATSLGLGSCWCGIHPQKKFMEKVRESLGLGANQIPFSMLKIGYPDEFPAPHEGIDEKRVHFI